MGWTGGGGGQPVCPELGQGWANLLCNSLAHRLCFAGLGAEIVIWVRQVAFGRDAPAQRIELTRLGRWGSWVLGNLMVAGAIDQDRTSRRKSGF